MKKLKSLLIISTCIQFSFAGIVDTVTVGDNFYNPSSLTIDLGDTVRFMYGGASSHPTASDNGSWVTFQMNSTNTVYDLILTAAGVYDYHCTVHGFGMSGSITVNDTVTTTSISSQPANDTVLEGADASFSITASNADSLQWQVDDGSGYTNLAGEVAASLTLNSVTLAMNGNKYRCMVFGNPDITSAEAILTVNEVPTSNGSATVLIKNNFYDPDVVSINVNDTVIFKWIEGTHPTSSVTSAFSDFDLNATDTIEEIIFTSEGVYEYYCTLHGNPNGGGMFGKILVGDVNSVAKKMNNTLMAYPNPVVDQLSIIHNYNDISSIQIYNSLGVIMADFKPSEMQSLDVSAFESGQYYIRISNTKGTIIATTKITKQ